MKYQCLNQTCKKTFMHTAESNCTEENYVTTHHICPYCGSKYYDLFTPKITSVKSVDLSEVDKYLKQGYEVEQLYSKTATLIKKEAG